MPITYSISGGADAGKFNIDGGTGALTFKVAPDFENPGDANKDNIYEVTVKATDAGGASSTQDIKVTVKDVSENLPPQITSAAVVSVNENQTTVLTVTATDPDDVPIPPTPSGNWPDATNTGVPAGTTLTNSGYINCRTNGQIVENMNISGGLSVNASNVTVKNCKIYNGGNSDFCVDIRDGYDNIKFINCEIWGDGTRNTAAGAIAVYIMGSTNITFDKCNIHDYVHCLEVGSGPLNVTNCYLHDLNSGGNDPHYDCIYYGGGTKPFLIQHNTLINQHTNQTASVFLENYWGALANVTIDNNYMSGGGFTTYCCSNKSSGQVSNIVYTNNAMIAGGNGYHAWQGNYVPTFTGNYDAKTNAPIT